MRRQFELFLNGPFGEADGELHVLGDSRQTAAYSLHLIQALSIAEHNRIFLDVLSEVPVSTLRLG